MPIYALGSLEPTIDPDAFIHPQATLIGNVVIGAGSSVWPSAVLRGDSNRIIIGERTSVQDGAILHCTDQLETRVGDDCVIGHLAHLEGCVIESGALVGSGAIVLHRARVGSGALVGAAALVAGNTHVPGGALALGVPAKILEGRADTESIVWGAAHYVERAAQYRAELRRLD